MKVYVPTPLRMYTHKSSTVEAEGNTLAELFADLERQYPGLRFRVINEQEQIREHIKIFVNQEIASDLTFGLRRGDAVRISMALSGGATGWGCVHPSATLSLWLF
jgi:molybdopterin converting factor small subunit